MQVHLQSSPSETVTTEYVTLFAVGSFGQVPPSCVCTMHRQRQLLPSEVALISVGSAPKSCEMLIAIFHIFTQDYFN